MKRDPRLFGLSSDHHHALVLARKVARACDDGTADGLLASAVRETFETDLLPHFAVEEEILFPALEDMGLGDLVHRAKEDHAEIREEIERATNGDLEGLLTFAEALADHVRFEERELFPAAEHHLPAEVLETVLARTKKPLTRRRYPPTSAPPGPRPPTAGSRSVQHAAPPPSPGAFRTHSVNATRLRMRTWISGLAAAVIATSASTALAETKVAVIDMQRAINDTNEGARATDTLKKLFDKRQVELDAKQTDLLKQKGDLEKRCHKLGQEKCQAGMEDLQKRLFDLQQLMVQYQQEIQKKQGEATQPIIGKMVSIVKRIALSNGYDIVVDRAASHYMRSDLDVTDAAVKMYNAESNSPPFEKSSEKKDAKPAPKAAEPKKK
jgi:outer membrane protein